MWGGYDLVKRRMKKSARRRWKRTAGKSLGRRRGQQRIRGFRGAHGTQRKRASNGLQRFLGYIDPIIQDKSDEEVDHFSTSQKYFYFTDCIIDSIIVIQASHFSNIDGVMIDRFDGIDPGHTYRLFVNGTRQESDIYELTESNLTLKINNGDIIYEGTPIVVETNLFAADTKGEHIEGND